MIRSVLTAIALSVPALAAAQLPSPLPVISAGNARVDHYPAHTANFLNGVQGVPSVIYWQQIGYRALTLDLYLPPGSVPRPATGFPLVVFIHGGGWLGGDAHKSSPFADFPGVLASLSARGYVVASIEYRLSSEARFPAQIQDVKAAIRWLRINASKYGIDPARAMTWGVSAGGYLAGLAAVSCNAADLEPKQTGKAYAAVPVADSVTSSSNVSDCVQGAVTWFGVFDMATIDDQAKEDKAMSRDAADAPEWQLLGCFGNSKCDPKRIAAASPVTYVDRNSSPMLLIVGSGDTLVPYHQTLEMAEKLKSAGIRHELIVLPGINHSFIGKTPEQTRDANLKVLDATFRFIDRTIGSASKSGQR